MSHITTITHEFVDSAVEIQQIQQYIKLADDVYLLTVDHSQQIKFSADALSKASTPITNIMNAAGWLNKVTHQKTMLCTAKQKAAYSQDGMANLQENPNGFYFITDAAKKAGLTANYASIIFSYTKEIAPFAGLIMSHRDDTFADSFSNITNYKDNFIVDRAEVAQLISDTASTLGEEEFAVWCKDHLFLGSHYDAYNYTLDSVLMPQYVRIENVTNKHFKLRAVITALYNNPNILLRCGKIEITDIPHYNASDDETKEINNIYWLMQESDVAGFADYSIRYNFKKLAEIMGCPAAYKLAD